MVRAFKSSVGSDRSTCRIAADYIQADRLISSQVYDCIILSLDISREEGLSFLKRLNEGGGEEVIIITAEESQEEAALNHTEYSFDGYLQKPYQLADLHSCMKTHLKRKLFGPENQLMQFGDLEIDPESRVVYIGRQFVPLTRKETLLLLFLLRNPNRVVSTKAIYERLLFKESDSPSNYSAVYEYMKNLKRKLSSFNYSFDITNVKSVGYRFEWNAEIPVEMS